MVHVKNQTFRDLVYDASRQGIRCGLAHGDIRGNNIAPVDGKYWLLDWETAALDAPVLTDPISHMANDPSIYRRGRYRDRQRTSMLREADSASYDRSEVALALLYLAYRGDREARHMIDNWT
jgi:thiamine kinase-like enzyme